MADININFGAEDLNEIKKLIDNLYKTLIDIRKVAHEIGVVPEDMEVHSKKVAAEMLKATNELTKQERIHTKLNEASKAQAGSVTDLNNKYKEMKKTLDGLTNKTPQQINDLKKLKTELDKARGSTNEWGKALDSFQFKFNALGNIAANVLSGMARNILSLTREFISFDKVINSTQQSSDDFAKAMGGVKASVDAFNRAIASGNFEDFFDRMVKASIGAREYVEALDALADRQRSLTISEADTLKRQSELIAIWKNETGTKTIKEQIDALTELRQIQIDLGEKTQRQAKSLFNEEVKRVTSKTGLTEDEILTYIKLYDQQEKLVQIGTKLNDMAILEMRTSGKVGKSFKDRKQALLDEAETLGADVTAMRIYSRMVNDFTDKDRQVVVDKYKAWKEAEVAYIMENKRTMAALGNFNKQFLKEQKELITVGVKSVIPGGFDFTDLFAPDVTTLDERLKESSKRIQEWLNNDFNQWKANEDSKTKITELSVIEKLDLYANLAYGISELLGRETKAGKAAAIAQATIDTYAAGLSAFKSTPGGPGVKSLALIATIAIGLANVRKILAVKTPDRYASGGEIGGKAHSQGGTLIEAERGEFVVKKSAYQKNKDLVNAINAEDSMRIAIALSRDKKIESPRVNYTKKLYELLASQKTGYETKDYYVIQKGNNELHIEK